MKNAKGLFHIISYLQYPVMIVAIFYCYKPLLFGAETIWMDLNKGLVFLGLGLSLATLQDTTKTQNKISKKVFSNPKYARIFLIYLVCLFIFSTSFGLFGLYVSSKEALQELSFGLIVLGIGIIGVLKTAVEMSEKHQQKMT
jgi:magnesium-transporting ATPase (P-type)